MNSAQFTYHHTGLPDPVIIDVDGVAAEFTTPILSACGSPLRHEDITQWDMFKLLEEEHRARAFNILENESFWLSQPLIAGAVEGVKFIRDLGYEVVWSTSPWASCKTWENARRQWLRAHFNARTDDVMVGSRKHLVRGSLFIDDKLENVTSWQKDHPGRKAVLFDAPYNRGVNWPHRMNGWADIKRFLSAW